MNVRYWAKAERPVLLEIRRCGEPDASPSCNHVTHLYNLGTRSGGDPCRMQPISAYLQCRLRHAVGELEDRERRRLSPATCYARVPSHGRLASVE
jgi:hypothetical protein